MQRSSAETFGALLRRQAAALGVPVVNTTGTGLFSSPAPLPQVSLVTYTLGRPDLWRYVPEAGAIMVEAGYFQQTYVADAGGHVLAQVPAGAEHGVVAEVTLPDTLPQPDKPQPRSGVSPFAYMLDEFANAMLRPVYRQAVRRVYGAQMAPVAAGTGRWAFATLLAGVLGFLVARRRR